MAESDDYGMADTYDFLLKEANYFDSQGDPKFAQRLRKQVNIMKKKVAAAEAKRKKKFAADMKFLQDGLKKLADSLKQ